MKFGIDIGNGYTKFTDGKFASRVKIGEKVSFGKAKKEVHYIKYEGMNYIVGEGAIFTGDERYFSKEYEICLLTSIALSSKGEDFIDANLVIGLPEKKHKLIAQKLKNHIKKLGQKQITVDEVDYTIKIEDVLIFIEGAYPILKDIEDNVIVIDNGAGTINVTHWEDLSIVNSATYTESMYKMYAEIASYLNLNKGTDFKPTDIEKIFNKKTIIVNQEEVDISDIRKIISSHIKEIASYIKNDFKVKEVAKIYLVGGGAYDTINYWQKEFKITQIKEDVQFVNQKIYEMIAKEEFDN